MVEAWEAHGYRFGCVCIDDGWTVDGKLGDWEPNPQRFPDLLALEGDAADIRCTAWEKDGVVKRLVMNVGTEAYTAKFAGKAMSLQPGEVAMV